MYKAKGLAELRLTTLQRAGSMSNESTANETASSDPTLEPDIGDIPMWLLALHASVVAVLLVSSVIANSLALFLVAKYRQLRYRSILVSLGVVAADLLLPIALHFQALSSSVAREWPFGEVGCIIFGYLLFSLYYVRWLCIAIIVADRFVAIMWPYFYRRWSKPLLIVGSVGAWVVPFLVAAPGLFGFGKAEYRSTLTLCVADCGDDRGCFYVLVSTFGLYLLIGCALPTVLYLILYCFGRNKRRAQLSRHRLGTQPTSATKPQPNLNRRRSSTPSIIQAAKDQRALVTFLIVFITLIVTQFPIYIISSIRRTDFYQDIPIYVHYLLTDIYMLSTTLDPIIVMRNRDFRHTLLHLVGRRSTVSDLPLMPHIANGLRDLMQQVSVAAENGDATTPLEEGKLTLSVLNGHTPTHCNGDTVSNGDSPTSSVSL